MDPLWILLIGVTVVVGGVLVLRLHAFLALTIGALVVGAVTPTDAIRNAALAKKMTEAEATSLAAQGVGERVAAGFGRTCAKIGILIAMASIIGKCLLESGAADRIIRSALRLLGEARASLAFMSSGFLLGIPVFFDTVFYLMIPLGKAMRMRTGRNYLLYVLSITAGATMAHSLVPPTPGPLLVASELQVDIGTMILAGCFVGIFTSGFGLAYAHFANRIWNIPLRDSADVSLAQLEELSQRDDSQLPKLIWAILPILLPVVLIGGNTILSTIAKSFQESGVDGWKQSMLSGMETIAPYANTLGNKNIALVISAAIAVLILIVQRRPRRQALADSLQTAISGAGIIILITAAGGAFGGVLEQSNIGGRIKQLSETYHIAVLPLAFAVTALVRTAQGSATVAMITAVAILAPMAQTADLGFHPVYIALAIGCGSKPIAWMNDSGFWVICKMSGMTEIETLKTLTPMTTSMGFVGLAVTMVSARLVPLL